MCKTCGKGELGRESEPTQAQSITWTGDQSTADEYRPTWEAMDCARLQPMLERHERDAKMLSNMFLGKRKDPEHIPEWTKRKRL